MILLLTQMPAKIKKGQTVYLHLPVIRGGEQRVRDSETAYLRPPTIQPLNIRKTV